MAEETRNEIHFATKATQRHTINGPLTSRLDNAEHGAKLCERKSVAENQSSYLYTRWANPTTDVAAEVVRDLEGGYAAILTASGMSSIISVFWTFLKAGDHVVAPLCVYGGTHEFLKNIISKFAVEVTWVDSKDVNNYKAAIKSNTKLLYGETPANPTLNLLDLEAFGKIGKEHSILTVVDSTFASPYNQNPLKHGVDIVVHSATKYLGGHSDLTAGAVVCSTKEQQVELMETMRLLGSTLSPFDSFLLYRGMKTLDVRMERHNSNALKIAQHLEKHPKIFRVYYPFLESHPQHTLAVKQMKGGSGMIAFEVRGGVDAGKTLIENVRLITLAVSLGGVESLIEHAASMTHTEVSREQRLQGGITDGLIRFSVGLEDHRDLIADLDRALEHVKISDS